MADKNSFITTLAPIAQAEYQARSEWILPSVCIAQAALESGWNLNASTLFGIKGSGFTAVTKEFVNGQSVTVQASFKSYPNVTAAVHGYYDLIAKARYTACRNNTDYKAVANALCSCGYATDPVYAEKVISIIESNNLTQYDVPHGGIACPYTVGYTYTLQSNVAVRKDHSTSAALVGYKNLTPNAQKHDVDKNSCLEAGTRVTCKDVYQAGFNWWM